MVYLHEAVFCANVTIYTSHLIDKSLKINIYKNIILNKLNYASRIWIPNVSKTDRKNLKRINKRALKLLNRGASVISTKLRYNLWDIDQLAMYSGIINTKKQITVLTKILDTLVLLAIEALVTLNLFYHVIL